MAKTKKLTVAAIRQYSTLLEQLQAQALNCGLKGEFRWYDPKHELVCVYHDPKCDRLPDFVERGDYYVPYPIAVFIAGGKVAQDFRELRFKNLAERREKAQRKYLEDLNEGRTSDERETALKLLEKYPDLVEKVGKKAVL